MVQNYIHSKTLLLFCLVVHLIWCSGNTYSEPEDPQLQQIYNLEKILNPTDDLEERRNHDSLILKWNMKRGESMFIGKKGPDKDAIDPIMGYHVKDKKITSNMQVWFAAHPPLKSQKTNQQLSHIKIDTGFSLSNRDFVSYSGDVFSLPAQIQDRSYPLNLIKVPVKLEDISIYVVPVSKATGHTKRMFLFAVTKNRKKLKRHLDVRGRNFNWSDWFRKIK